MLRWDRGIKLAMNIGVLGKFVDFEEVFEVVFQGGLCSVELRFYCHNKFESAVNKNFET